MARIVQCKVEHGEVWMKISDFLLTLGDSASDILKKRATEEDQRDKDRLDGQLVATHEIEDALKRYEIQMKRA